MPPEPYSSTWKKKTTKKRIKRYFTSKLKKYISAVLTLMIGICIIGSWTRSKWFYHSWDSSNPSSEIGLSIDSKKLSTLMKYLSSKCKIAAKSTKKRSICLIKNSTAILSLKKDFKMIKLNPIIGKILIMKWMNWLFKNS